MFSFFSHLYTILTALSSLVEGQGNDEGWTSWAWSMVPEVFSYDEEENEEETLRQRNNEDPIISVGFYCHQGSFTFKVSMALYHLDVKM